LLLKIYFQDVPDADDEEVSKVWSNTFENSEPESSTVITPVKSEAVNKAQTLMEQVNEILTLLEQRHCHYYCFIDKLIK